MNIKPMLFSAPMIISLIKGRKSQTRRLSPVGSFKKGDLIWVKENYRLYDIFDGVRPGSLRPKTEVLYVADSFYVQNERSETLVFGKTRPSIFMCKWMSRITLEVTKVRTEPLKKISDMDCWAEGVAPEELHPRTEFIKIWDNINGHISGHGFEDNPWVTVVEFKVHYQNIDRLLQARAA